MLFVGAMWKVNWLELLFTTGISQERLILTRIPSELSKDDGNDADADTLLSGAKLAQTKTSRSRKY